jgi:hypothetical protein
MLFVTSAPAAVIWQDNFESGLGDIAAAPANISFTAITNPFGSGNVLQVTRTAAGSGTTFSQVNSNSGTSGTANLGRFAIVSTPGNPAIGDTFTLDFDVYVPTGTPATSLSTVVRLNPQSSSTQRFDFTAPLLNTSFTGHYDQWVHITLTGTIPATFAGNGVDAGNTFTTTVVAPLISWKQNSPSTTTGTFGYMDNINFTVVPEPSTWALLAGAGTFFMVIRRRRCRA